MKKDKNKFSGIFSFSFICPKGKEGEAIELFREKKLGLLSPDYYEYTRNWVDRDSGKITEVKGYNFSGVTDLDGMVKIIKEFSKRKIASYSRETQVLFKPLTDPTH